MSAGTIIHFELLSAHFERSAAFYADVFGWKADDSQAAGHRGFQPATGPGGSWVLEALAHATGPVPFIGVTDLEASMAAVEKAGGRILVRRQSLGTRGAGALFVDPDGNVMGLMSAPALAQVSAPRASEPLSTAASTSTAASPTAASSKARVAKGEAAPRPPKPRAPATKKKTPAR